MRQSTDLFAQSRRRFLSTVIPACSITCLGLKSGFAQASGIGEKKLEQAAEHKFLKEYRTLSLRDYWRLKFREYIGLVEELSGELGRDRILNYIKRHTYEDMLRYGTSQAEGVTTGHFSSYINSNFRGPEMEEMLTMEIVEDNERAFKIKVTECIFADAFLHYKAGDIGYAKVCHGDYGWAEGYHPNIRLTRDKTLMEDHSHCNHRYTWIG